VATSVAKIQAELDLDSGKFTGTVTSAAGVLRNFNSNINNTDRTLKNLERRITGVGASLRDTMVILGQFRGAMHTLWAMTGQWVGAIIDANAKLERMQVLMKGLSRSTTEVGKLAESFRDMNYVLDKSKNAPFSIDQISNAFVKLKASGIDPARGSLQSLMDATAAFGGDDQSFARATLAIQQMAGKGVISMEELRQQLGEAMPNAMQMMAAATSMSMGELVKIISQGRLEANSALSKLFLEMKYQYEGSAENMMQTWTGMIQKLKTEWMLFAKAIGDGGLFEEAKSALGDLIKYMGSEDGRKLARDLGGALKEAGRMAVDLVNFLIKNREEIVSWGKLLAQIFVATYVTKFAGSLVSAGVNVVNFTRSIGALSTAIAGARAGTVAWSTVLAGAAGPVGIAITAITALIFKLWDNYRASLAAAEGMQRYYNATAQGKAVSAQEHSDMEKRLDYLRRVKEATDEFNNTKSRNSTYGRERLNNKMGDLLIEGREYGFVTDAGNSLADKFSTLNDKVSFLSEMYQANITTAVQNISKQAQLQNERAAEQTVAKFGDRLRDIVQENSPEIRNQLNVLSEQLRNGEINADQHREKRNALINTRLDDQISRLQQARNSLATRLAGMSKDEAGYQAVAAMMGETNKQLELVYAERATIESDVKLLPKMGEGDKKQGNPLKDYYESVVGKVAQLRGQLEDVNPTLERFNAQLAAGKYGASPNQGMVGQIRAVLKEMDELSKKVKEDRATERLKQDLEELDAKTSADVVSARMKASGDLYSQVAGGMVGFNRQVAVMRAGLDKTNMSLEEFDAKVSSIKEMMSSIEVINLTEYVRNREWDAYLDSLPKRARDLEEFNRAMEENAILRRNMHANDPDGKNSKAIDDLADRLDETTRREYANATKPAFVKLLEDWQDVTTSIDEMWANSMENITDSIADGVVEGKISFKSLADYMLKEITRILVSKAVAKLVEFVIGIMGGGTSFNPNSGGSTITTNSTTGINSGIVASAKGNAFSNGQLIQPFAKGGAFTNQIVGETTIAPMAMFGEAGDEAIMPLSRDGSGRLGVTVHGEGQGGGTQIINDLDIQIVIQDGQGSSKTNVRQADQMSKELANLVDGRIRGLLVEESRPGGIIWRQKNNGR